MHAFFFSLSLSFKSPKGSVKLIAFVNVFRLTTLYWSVCAKRGRKRSYICVWVLWVSFCLCFFWFFY